MKTIATLLTLAALGIPTTLDTPEMGEVIMQPNQKACTIHWTHPTAYEFVIYFVVGGKTNSQSLGLNTHRSQKRHDFKRLMHIEPGTNRFRIQAIDGDLKSKISGETVVFVK